MAMMAVTDLLTPARAAVLKTFAEAIDSGPSSPAQLTITFDGVVWTELWEEWTDHGDSVIEVAADEGSARVRLARTCVISSTDERLSAELSTLADAAQGRGEATSVDYSANENPGVVWLADCLEDLLLGALGFQDGLIAEVARFELSLQPRL